MFSLLPHIPWSIRSDLCKIAGHHPWFLKDPYEESDPTYTPIPRETRLKWLSMMSHCKVRYDIRPILTSNTAEGIFLAARPLRDRGGGWGAYSFIAYLRRMIWPLKTCLSRLMLVYNTMHIFVCLYHCKSLSNQYTCLTRGVYQSISFEWPQMSHPSPMFL